MLELGRGFAFIGRQYRISTETKHFYIDLVFYNYILKCFVLIDLKAGELTHQDIGQIHPMRYYYAMLLCIYFALIERWQFLCWLFQQFKKASWRAQFAARYQHYFHSEQELIEEIEREKSYIVRELKARYG